MSEITAKLIQILEPESGEGKNGPWKKQGFIFETEGEYPRKICILNWGDKVSPDILKVGHELKISVNIESREFNGKWYTDVKMWKAEKLGAPAESAPDEGRFEPPEESELDDGLPF
jgi:hypothetical protein